MFKSKKAIIYVKRDKLVFSSVITRPPIKIKNKSEYEWTKDSLTKILTELKKKYKLGKVRILLDRNVSYVVKLRIEKALSGQAERAAIAEKIIEQFPENLDDEDWDYKEISVGKKEKVVIVFAPVKDVFEVISVGIKKAGLEVEAVEPELVALSRHKDPAVGLALKKDLKGNDEDVLNLEIKSVISGDKVMGEEKAADKTDKEEIQNDKTEKKETKHSGVKIVFLLIVIFGAIGFGVYYYISSSKDKAKSRADNVKTELEDVVSLETIVESVEIEPEPREEEVVDLSIYSIQILNGTGISGVAGEVYDILLAEGFEEIEIGNADSQDNVDTQVKLKGSVPSGVFDVVDRALNGDFTIIQSDEVLTDDSDYDVVIIVGDKQVL